MEGKLSQPLKRAKPSTTPEQVISTIQELRQENQKNENLIKTLKNDFEREKTVNQSNNKQTKNEKTINNLQKNDKNSNNIKIFVTNTTFTQKTVAEINSSLITNFEIQTLSAVKNNPKTLIMEIKDEDLEKALNKNNWINLNKHTTITTDRKNKNLKTYCINKISDETTPNLLPSQAEIILINEFNINPLSIRFNNVEKPTLILFEIRKNLIEKIKEKSIKNNNIIHNIRQYDPVENYIIKCTNCHEFDHFKNECKKKKKCARCGGESCNFKCEKKDYKCVNCQGNHSSNYKGCKIFKKKIEQGITLKKEKQKENNLNELNKRTTNLQTSYVNLQKTYAECIISKNEKNEKIETLESQICKIENNIKNIATKIMELERVLITTTEQIQKMPEILYELLYGILYQKIDDTSQLCFTIIDAFLRVNPNLNKEETLNNLAKIEQNSLLFSPIKEQNLKCMPNDD